jgi:uncharacterized membrane protein YdbT with pleckstrin-like domain
MAQEPEQTHYEAHPAMFRAHPIGFVVSVLLIAAFGLGLVILLFWWLACLGTTLAVTNRRVILRRGLLSKSVNEVWHTDVSNVQFNQSFWQRITGVGDIGISTAAQAGIEIQVAGIPNPDAVVKIINEHRGR